MNPAVFIVAGAFGLGIVVFIAGLIYERRHQQEKKREAAQSKLSTQEYRSRVYDLQIQDHRRSLLWMTGFTVILVGVALLEWSTFGFRSEWPTANGTATQMQRGDAIGRDGREYYVDVWYRFNSNNARYEGSGRLSYREEGRRDEVYNNILDGSQVRVWYHPILPMINFPWRTGPGFAIVLLVLGALTGLGMISSGLQLVTTKIRGGPKQRPNLTIKKGEY